MKSLLIVLAISLTLPSFIGSRKPKEKVTFHCGQATIQTLLKMCERPADDNTRELCNHPIVQSIGHFCKDSSPYNQQEFDYAQVFNNMNFKRENTKRDRLFYDSDGTQQSKSSSEEELFYDQMLDDVTAFFSETETDLDSSK